MANRRKAKQLLAGREFQSISRGNCNEYVPFYQAEHTPATFRFPDALMSACDARDPAKATAAPQAGRT
jgi:hypothetical protein